MKKFLMMFALILGFAVSMNAQTALVDNGTAKDNWYIGGGIGTNVWNDGTSWTLFNANPKDGSSWWQTQPIHVDVYGGKMITPYVGVEVDYAAGFNIHGSNTFIDAHNLTGNVVVNLTNLFGYSGTRRSFELELLGGAGWLHGFDDNQNGMTARGALRGNFNVNKNLAITVTPEYIYTIDAFDFDYAHGVNISVGVKYRIPSKRGNFPIKKLRSQSEIDNLNATIAKLTDANETLSKANEDLADALNKALSKGDNVIVKTQSVGTLFFEQGKSEVSSSDVDKVIAALKETGGSIVLTGNTSPEGGEKVNSKLASDRADAVKKALVDGGIDASRITINNDYANKRSVVVTVE